MKLYFSSCNIWTGNSTYILIAVGFPFPICFCGFFQDYFPIYCTTAQNITYFRSNSWKMTLLLFHLSLSRSLKLDRLCLYTFSRLNAFLINHLIYFLTLGRVFCIILHFFPVCLSFSSVSPESPTLSLGRLQSASVPPKILQCVSHVALRLGNHGTHEPHLFPCVSLALKHRGPTDF